MQDKLNIRKLNEKLDSALNEQINRELDWHIYMDLDRELKRLKIQLPIGFTMRNQLTHELGIKREFFQKL
jgi:hypothetical protein